MQSARNNDSANRQVTSLFRTARMKSIARVTKNLPIASNIVITITEYKMYIITPNHSERLCHPARVRRMVCIMFVSEVLAEAQGEPMRLDGAQAQRATQVSSFGSATLPCVLCNQRIAKIQQSVSPLYSTICFPTIDKLLSK